MAMDKDIKAKWVEDLRASGHLRGVGRLCEDGRYCCLGRLCEVMGVEKRDATARTITYKCWPGHEDPWSSAVIMGGLAGVSDGAAHRLTNMNDSGKTFSEIADWIEANL